MQTQAYFENIQNHILSEIEQAHSSIQLAVAWFTDENLFKALCGKARKGVAIELMIMSDEINNSCGINYDLLCNAGGKVWKINTFGATENLMHNKFCIIDNSTVINGSYNWTKKAQHNHESITIISENIELALQFSDEFRSIKEKYFGKDTESIVVDFGIICSRLSTLKETIRTGDAEDIDYLAAKLKKHIKLFSDPKLSTIVKIIDYIERRYYSEAVDEITLFINRYKSLTVYTDTEIAALRLELRSLELRISSLEDEKIEHEKLIHEFEVRHNRELGDIILKILKLKAGKYKFEARNNPEKEKDYEEAEQDYRSFYDSYETLKEEKIFELTEEQKKELKIIFRRASKLCHPDAVDEEHKKDAEEIFKDLNNAYSKNDFEKVQQILNDLEKGIFTLGSDTINEKGKLLIMIKDLRRVYERLEKEVRQNKQDITYKLLISI
jgi:hypothetical protein